MQTSVFSWTAPEDPFVFHLASFVIIFSLRLHIHNFC